MKQHDQYEKLANEWQASYLASGKTIYCRAGCSGCCHLAVHATYPEVIAVAVSLAEVQLKRLSDYVEELRNALPEFTNLKSYLKKHRQALGPCPFLDEQGVCSIYSTRPLSCRALLSTRPAAWCTVDFSKLEHWDKQAYTSSLDPQVVTWPTHYVAATRDFAQEMEKGLLESMQSTRGWSLSGNFAVMVWLEINARLSRVNDTDRIKEALTDSGLFNDLLLKFTSKSQITAPSD